MRPADTAGFGPVGTNGNNGHKLTLGELHIALTEAMEIHSEAESQESAARSKLTDAVNRLNAAQKALDKAMEELRGKAPWNTDWWGKRNRAKPDDSSEVQK